MLIYFKKRVVIKTNVGEGNAAYDFGGLSRKLRKIIIIEYLYSFPSGKVCQEINFPLLNILFSVPCPIRYFKKTFKWTTCHNSKYLLCTQLLNCHYAFEQSLFVLWLGILPFKDYTIAYRIFSPIFWGCIYGYYLQTALKGSFRL